MTNNEANPWPFHGKYQPEHFLPRTPLPLRLLQRTLDAVVPLSVVFSPPDSLSAPTSDDDVLILHRVRRTGYAIFILVLGWCVRKRALQLVVLIALRPEIPFRLTTVQRAIPPVHF